MSSLGNDTSLANDNPVISFVSQVLRNLTSPPRKTKTMIIPRRLIGYNYIKSTFLFSYPKFCPIINRTIFQHIYENCLKPGAQSLARQEGNPLCWSRYLFLGAQRNSTKRSSYFLPLTPVSYVLHRCYLLTKRPSHFLPMKTPVNHSYYRDCPIALYYKREL